MVETSERKGKTKRSVFSVKQSHQQHPREPVEMVWERDGRGRI